MTRVLRFLADWPLLPYNLLLILAAPIVLPLKAWRYWKKGWKREYDFRRWLIPVHSPSPLSQFLGEGPGVRAAPHIVFVATGWGEMRLAALLDEAWKRLHPTARTTWILRDGEAAAAAQREYSDQTISFLPFDFLVPSLICLRRLQPDVVVFIEKFWFPTFVRSASNWGAKLIVVNARTRAHESARYQLFAPFHRWIAGSFDGFVFQSETDRGRAQEVLAPHTRTSAPGNLKFALRPRADAAKTERLRDWLSGASTLLAAGSLEAGDLSFVLRAFEVVREKTPCRLLVAPRRLHEVEAMQDEIAARGWTISRRSQSSDSAADVYLLDTMGELATAYQFCVAAFIGGTLKSGAGHNVVEPLVFGAAVSYGPNRGFFESVQRACEAAGVGFRVSAPEELAAHWLEVLESESLRSQVSTQAARLLETQSGALDANLEMLAELAESRVAS